VCIAHRWKIPRLLRVGLFPLQPDRTLVSVKVRLTSITDEMAPFIDDVRNVIGTSPAIDIRARDLLRLRGSRSSNFLTMTPEVIGGALKSATNVSQLFRSMELRAGGSVQALLGNSQQQMIL
jgi:hypothetical protein